MADEMSSGEIGRSLKRLEDSQTVQMNKLDEIKDETSSISVRLQSHEERLNSHDRELRDLKRRPAAGHELKRATDRSDVITVNIPAGAINPKTIALVLSAIVSGLFAAWRAGAFS